MGGNESRSSNTNEFLTDIIAEVITNDVSNASIGSYVQQRISLSNVHGVKLKNIDMIQVVKLKSTATKSAQSMADLQNKITASLASEISSNATGFGLMNTSEVDVRNKISTRIKNSITNNTIQNCLTQMDARNDILLENVTETTLEEITMDQTIEAFNQCVQQNESVMQAAADISSDLKLKATATVENPITGSLNSLFQMFGFIGVLVLIGFIVVAIIAYKFYSSTAGAVTGTIKGTVGALGSAVVGVAGAASSAVTGVATAVAK